MPETLPIPFAGLSAVLGVPLVLLSGHLLIFGESGGVPASIGRRKISTALLKKVAKFGVPVLQTIERFSRPRLSGVAGRYRLLGLLCLILSIVILAPIPMVNSGPAICLAIIAFGIVQRDGVFIVGGVLLSLAFSAALYLLGMIVFSN